MKSSIRQFTFAMMLAVSSHWSLHAETPYLVKDINSTTNGSPSSSNPNGFFSYGSRVFFSARAGGSGFELWSTDGTATGTKQVADIYPGSSSSNPGRFAVVNGVLVFNATDSHGDELWYSDGTTAGTRVLADINALGSSSPGDRVVYQNKLLVSANDGLDGREPWITDGTPGGTRLLKDLVPGSGGSDPRSFVLFHDSVYFAAANGLWKSDGTAGGTVNVKLAIEASALTVAGDRLFFLGYTSEKGTELYVSDGTDAGTHAVPLTPIPARVSSGTIAAFGDRVLFAASETQHGSELWISDGTSAGTSMVRDMNPGSSSSLGSVLSVAVIGDIAFLMAGTTKEGLEVWRTDGTDAGTTIVADSVPGPAGISPGTNLAVSAGRVFFVSGDGALWVTDGMPSGTGPVMPPDPRFKVGSIQDVRTSAPLPILTAIGGTIYFAGANQLDGYELCRSDGTDAGTSMIANLAADSAPSAVPGHMTPADDWIYFDAWDGLSIPTSSDLRRSLWRSDGTREGTIQLLTSPTSDYIAAGRSLFFQTQSGLWITDGTPEGTRPATNFTNRFPAHPTIRFVRGNTIFATTDDSLWTTPITSDEPAVRLGHTGGGFVEVASRVMFFAGNGLWITDGSPSGTHAVVPDLVDSPSLTTGVMGGNLYFCTVADGGSKRLWKSDGSFEGTAPIVGLPGVGDVPGSFTAAAGKLFFLMNRQLWVTDGSPTGTHPVSSVPDDPQISSTGERVIFGMPAGTSRELWVSDGTVEGTHPLRPGISFPYGSDLINIQGRVYFTSADPTNGYELWVTDGTAEGTRLVAVAGSGGAGSFPRQLAGAGERVFFTASTPETGTELWALLLTPSRLTIGDVRVTEGDAGSTIARFPVTLSSPALETVTVGYATSDGSAHAGSDYDATTGTLTFAAGETTKNIDVRVLSNTTADNNRVLIVTLSNPFGAAISKASAFAIIEDDDQLADVSLTPDFGRLREGVVLVNTVNNGPATATNLSVVTTRTPVSPGGAAPTCSALPTLLSAGGRGTCGFDSGFGQQYATGTIRAYQRDPQLANNRHGWTINGSIAMDALYLTPGSEGNVWLGSFQSSSSATIESSNPEVISVPASVAFPSDGKLATFVARALGLGTATIRAVTTNGVVSTIRVDVVSSGTTVRWPGALTVYGGGQVVPFDQPITVPISPYGQAPYTGETATGVVTIRANGQEVGSVTLPRAAGSEQPKVYLPDIGVNSIRVDYSGDANFLPSTDLFNVTATRGFTSLEASAVRNGTNATVHVRVTGSPRAFPTGTIFVSEPGIIAPVQVALIPGTAGIGTADVNLTNVSPGPHTLLVNYPGDGHYTFSTQNVRVHDGRRRSASH